ncbi:hypothetical protein D3C73_929160 [compost metagenome]
MAKNKNEMTKKTKYWMYSGSFLYGVSMIVGLPYVWRFLFLITLTLILTFIIDEPINGFIRKIVTTLLFLFFVGSLIGIGLMMIKLLIMM